MKIRSCLLLLLPSFVLATERLLHLGKLSLTSASASASSTPLRQFLMSHYVSPTHTRNASPLSAITPIHSGTATANKLFEMIHNSTFGAVGDAVLIYFAAGLYNLDVLRRKVGHFLAVRLHKSLAQRFLEANPPISMRLQPPSPLLQQQASPATASSSTTPLPNRLSTTAQSMTMKLQQQPRTFYTVSEISSDRIISIILDDLFLQSVSVTQVLSWKDDDLVEGSAEVSALNAHFRAACLVNNLPVIRKLLESKWVDPGAHQQLAIRGASQFGLLEVVKLLLQDDRVDPSAMDQYSLCLAVEAGHASVVCALLKHPKVNANVRNGFVMKVALERGFTLIETILARHSPELEKMAVSLRQ